jgi:Na+/H+ antiporter NhaC
MEPQNQTQESPLFGLSIDPLIKSHLSETARWGKFLSIIGFICCALIVIGGIYFVTAVSSMERTYGGLNEGPSFSSFGPFFAVLYIVFALLYFFPCLFLLRFSNKMKTALAADSQADLTVSFQNLKVLFRYIGILTIIVLSLYLLFFLFGGLGMLLGR